MSDEDQKYDNVYTPVFTGNLVFSGHNKCVMLVTRDTATLFDDEGNEVHKFFVDERYLQDGQGATIGMAKMLRDEILRLKALSRE